jgi:succinate dehydrogenase/fumarate reductase flavoprotein subunit
MAGLVAAARARELGARPRVHEKGDRPGGSMVLSSGVVWRHRRYDDFRSDCPGGDLELQRLVWERLPEALVWLEGLGAPVVERSTGNPLTEGTRFDPAGLTGALLGKAGEPLLREPLRELPEGATTILATGGFQASRELVRRHITPQADHLVLRSNPWSTGDGLSLGLAAGAGPTAGMDEFYGRNMPAPPARVHEADFVRLAQLYAHHAEVEAEDGERFVSRAWSEVDVVQWTARRPRARARYRVAERALQERVRDGTVGDMVEAAEAAGAPVQREPGGVTVEVVAGITTTLGGLAVDARARAAEGVFAAGADAGGVATGGYSSGLAAALVLGLTAAESACDD